MLNEKKMKYTRLQTELFPPNVKEYIRYDDPVQAYNTFIKLFNLAKLNLIIEEIKIDNLEYNLQTIINLLVYEYSYKRIVNNDKENILSQFIIHMTYGKIKD